MPSKISIQQEALIYLEEDPNTSIDNSDAGSTIDILFDRVYLQLLKKNSVGWSFAAKVSQNLAQVSNARSYLNYRFIYQLPNDFLQMMQPVYSNNTYKIIGKYLYSYDDKFQMLYVADPGIENVSEEFATVLAYDLASKTAGKITGKQGIIQRLEMKYFSYLEQAINTDNQNMDTQQFMPRDNTSMDGFYNSGSFSTSLSGLNQSSKNNGDI